MDSGERGLYPITMTIINPRKEYWPSRGSNQQHPVLKSATLPTELWGSAFLSLKPCLPKKGPAARDRKKLPVGLNGHYL